MEQVSLTLDDVRDALMVIPDDRETWVQMAMAIKSEFGDDGKDVWVNWSESGDSYNKADADAVWNSCTVGKVTIGTLIYLAKQNGHKFTVEDLSKEEKARRKELQELQRKENEKRAQETEEQKQAWRERVAAACNEIHRRFLSDSGKSAYLQDKKVKGYGLLYVRHGFIVATHIVDERIELISGKEAISKFFDRNKAGDINKEIISFRYVKYGHIAVPMCDIDGKLWGFQFITETGSKAFLKFARKQGLFHLIAPPGLLQGPPSNQRPPGGGHLIKSEPETLSFAEGYSTAATILMATKWPVVITFDAGNIKPVAAAFRGVYPNSRFIFCGDDDIENTVNDGRRKALAAADLFYGKAVFPDFSACKTEGEGAA